MPARRRRAIAARAWRARCSVTGKATDSPVPERFAHTAVHAIPISSAAAIAHEQRVRLHITQDVAREAIRRLRAFLGTRSFGALVWVYGADTFVENHAAVRHYGGPPETDFVLGRRHRPWVRYRLDDELLTGLALGTYRLDVRDGRRWVGHTPRGERQYRTIRRMLEASGYLERRLRLIALSQFDLFADWDDRVAAVVPAADRYRRAFTIFAGLQPGMAVLEAGCGMASQTFEGGLWEAVGPMGTIVGIDPAMGMLRRAEEKATQRHATNVRFVQARAEDLTMFGDGAFDCAVGLSFLHFTDAPKALQELRRVTRPGGVMAIGGPCRLALDMPWFCDWFRPIMDLAKQHRRVNPALQPIPGHIPVRGTMRRHFQEAGLQEVVVEDYSGDWVLADPEIAVAFLIQGLSFFQRELELLPWQARLELIEELKRRGAEVAARTTPADRTIHWPGELVKGTVPTIGAG